MTDEVKLKLMEYRLQILNGREKENQGVCRRLNREIRNLKAKMQSQKENQ